MPVIPATNFNENGRYEMESRSNIVAESGIIFILIGIAGKKITYPYSTKLYIAVLL